MKRQRLTLPRTAVLLALLFGEVVPFAGVAGASTGSVTRAQTGLVASDSMTTGNMASWSVDGTAAIHNIFEDSQGLHIGVQSPSSGTWVNYYAAATSVNAQLFHATTTIPYTSVADGVFNPGFYVESSDYLGIVGCQPYADWSGYYWTLQQSNDAGNTWTTLYISGTSSLPQTQDCTVVTNGSNFLKVYLGGTVIFSSSSMALNMPSPLHIFFQVDTSSSMMRLATFANYYATANENVKVTNGPPGGTVQLVDPANNVLASAPVGPMGNGVMAVGMYTMPLNAYVKALDASGSLIASSSPLQIYGGDVYAVSGPPPTSPTATAVTPNPSSTTAGSGIAFSASVTDTGSAPSTPSGTTSWSDGGAGGSFSASTCTLSPGSPGQGQCTVTYTAPPRSGLVTITASYSGDSTHASSSGSSSLTVNAPALHPTTTAVTPNPGSVAAGNQITFTATVTDTSSSPSSLSGSVSWSDGGAGGSFVSSTCALSAASAISGSCQATYTSTRAAGTVTITASYFGDSVHASSSGSSSLSVKKFSLVKEANGLVAYDPLNNVTKSQQELQATSRYWVYGGSAQPQNAPYQFNEDPQGFHIGVQALASGKYAGFYAITPVTTAQVYHAVITEPSQTIPSDVYNTALYVQTANGSINYVFCGAQTLPSGVTWSVWSATGDTTQAKTFTQLWFDPSPNQPLTRSCTIVTNGSNYLAVYLDNSLRYQSSTLNLQMPSPFNAFLEVQSSYPGQMLTGTFTGFYATTGTALTVDNLPPSAANVLLVDQSGSILASSPASNGVAAIDIVKFTFPVTASIVVSDSSGSTLASSGVLSLVGGDRYGVVAG